MSISRRESPPEPVVGSYRVDNEIGKGSFATVYRAHSQDGRETVAIKVIHRSRLTKKLLDNLESEIKILKMLRHEHIVQLVDCCSSAHYINLVMEYCAYGDLFWFIRARDKLTDVPGLDAVVKRWPYSKRGGMNQVLVRHFLKQLASSIAFLRKHNLIHRDIKPQNLLLCPPPSPAVLQSRDGVPYIGHPDAPMLKLADFGFARYLQQASLAETLCGSPLYMAPEILRYEKYDARADLWSVGAVTFEMLVGKPPYRAQNHLELLKKIERYNDRISFPGENEFEGSDADIRSLIRRLLKRNPIDRIGFHEFFRDKVIIEPLSDDPKLANATTDLANLTIETEGSDDQDVQTIGRLIREKQDSRHVSAQNLPTPSPEPEPLQALPDELENSIQRSLKHGKNESMPQQSLTLSTSVHNSTDFPMQRRSHDSERAQISLSRRPSQKALDVSTGRLANLSNGPQSIDQDYVVVEKSAVKINTFADEMMNNRQGRRFLRRYSLLPRQADPEALQQPELSNLRKELLNQHTRDTLLGNDERPKLPQRQRIEEKPSAVPISNVTNDGNNTLSGAPRSSLSNIRRMSARRLSIGSSSALSKAISLASGKLFGGLSPPSIAMGSTPSSPSIAKFFCQPEVSMPLEDALFEQLSGILMRMNVVYQFSEVKLSQLIPESLLDATCATEGQKPQAQKSLPVQDMALLSEEAMTLYLKVLALLQRCMDVVSEYKKNPQASTTTRINAAVQWVREKFNECLEKAEFVKDRLEEARSGGHRFHESGIVAEKLLYDKALELSRSAAVSELVGEDSSECIQIYQTSTLLLEAVIEPLPKDAGSNEHIKESEIATVVQLMNSIRKRTEMLRTKMLQCSSSAHAPLPAHQPAAHHHSHYSHSPSSLSNMMSQDTKMDSNTE